MKNLRFLFACLIGVLFFLSSANAQENKISDKLTWGTRDEPFCFWCPCANDGAGEFLCGTIVLHIAVNSKVEHWTIEGNKLEGSETGKTYNFSRTSSFKPLTGELVLNIRTKGENGLTTYFQIIGEAGLDEYGEYVPLFGASVTWFCR